RFAVRVARGPSAARDPSVPVTSRRAAILVLDGVGAGEAHDAADYRDAGSNTLGHVAEAMSDLNLPAFESLGLGRVVGMRGLRDDLAPRAAWGSMQPASAGKDSTTGHWEITGLHLERAFPTYPTGFPADVIRAFEEATGRSVIANVVGSGTDIIDRYAAEQ